MSLSSSEDVGFLSVQIILLVFGGLANLVVIVIVWKHKQLHSFTNYFLVNLAIADLFVLLVGTAVDVRLILVDFSGIKDNTPTSPTETPKDSQPRDTSTKDQEILVSCLPILFKNLANLTLMCLAIGRYTALVKPFSTVTNILHRKYTIALLWGISVFGLIGCVIIGKIHDHYPSESMNYLAITFPIFSLVFLYVIPASIVVYCYGNIVKGIKIDKTILGVGETDGISDSLIKRTVCRLIIITVMSFMSTIPTIGFYIYMNFGNRIFSDLMKQIVFSITTLDKTVATLNPIIYALLNKSMRHAILKDIRHLKSPNQIPEPRNQLEDGDEMDNNMEEDLEHG